MSADVEETFSAFVAARMPALLRTAYFLTGDPYRAEDLVQTALAKSFLVWTRIHNGNPEAYVRRVMVTSHTDWWRRRPWLELSTASTPDRVTDGDAYGEHAQRDQVMRALRTLSARQRVVVVLRFYEQLSEQETAEAMGCSVGTVKSTLARALRKLRPLLEPSADERWQGPPPGGHRAAPGNRPARVPLTPAARPADGRSCPDRDKMLAGTACS